MLSEMKICSFVGGEGVDADGLPCDRTNKVPKPNNHPNINVMIYFAFLFLFSIMCKNLFCECSSFIREVHLYVTANPKAGIT